MDLILLSNREQVDSRMYPALQEMFDDARMEGYGLFVRDGYRTQEEQQELFDEKVLDCRRDGNSKSEAKINAMKWVAVPGASEHQTGLAVDINADENRNSSLELYIWLSENAYKKYLLAIKFIC
ncbi:MAG: D-alanyl-D-alanine carboxypeptidase family protein [Lachnospiraceae bacterium]|nr:D-alanyl-D-alanine carboxypeptidase family protein [Lachnospiraceae bacterium]